MDEEQTIGSGDASSAIDSGGQPDTSNPGTAPADGTLVAECLQRLVKGFRAIKLYLPNNPMYRRAARTLAGGFRAVWSEVDPLVLTVADNGFVWEGQRVLEESGRGDSISWILFRDGIRTITLTPGVEDEEILQLLALVHKAATLATDADEDLLTLLWAQDFRCLTYEYVEFDPEGVHPVRPTDTLDSAMSTDRVHAQLAHDVADAATPAGIVSIEDFDSTLYFLDQHEVQYLKQEIDREYQQNLHDNVLAMLCDLLELHKDEVLRGEVIAILDDLLPHLLADRDFHAVAYLLSQLRGLLEEHHDFAPPHRGALLRLPAKLSQPEGIGQLLQALDAASPPPPADELGVLLTALKLEAMDPVLSWLPRLTNKELVRRLEAGLERLVQTHPQVIRTALASDNPTVLLGALGLITRLKLPGVTATVCALGGHRDPAVRRAVVRTLAVTDVPGAAKQLQQLLADPDRDVRVDAVRALAAHVHRPALSAVQDAVLGRQFRSADQTEKRAFFEAYGTLADQGATDILGQVLLGGGIFRRKADPDTRACAALALGKARTPAAQAFLKRAQTDKEPLVRNAVSKALRGAA